MCQLSNATDDCHMWLIPSCSLPRGRIVCVVHVLLLFKIYMLLYVYVREGMLQEVDIVLAVGAEHGKVCDGL